MRRVGRSLKPPTFSLLEPPSLGPRHRPGDEAGGVGDVHLIPVPGVDPDQNPFGGRGRGGGGELKGGSLKAPSKPRKGLTTPHPPCTYSGFHENFFAAQWEKIISLEVQVKRSNQIADKMFGQSTAAINCRVTLWRPRTHEHATARKVRVDFWLRRPRQLSWPIRVLLSLRHSRQIKNQELAASAFLPGPFNEPTSS